MNIDLLKNEILQLYNDEKKLGKPISDIFDVIYNYLSIYFYNICDIILLKIFSKNNN